MRQRMRHYLGQLHCMHLHHLLEEPDKMRMNTKAKFITLYCRPNGIVCIHCMQLRLLLIKTKRVEAHKTRWAESVCLLAAFLGADTQQHSPKP